MNLTGMLRGWFWMKSSQNKQWWLLILAAVVLLIIILFIGMTGYYQHTVKKVGFIITGEVGDEGWNGRHYQGVKAACERLNLELLIRENVEEGTGKCAEAIHELVKEGASTIILTSYAYPVEVEEIISSYPEISFYGISAEYYADNMTSYFGRMYQARYLAGIVAGMQSKTGDIGYVAAMANSEVNRGINAFTLGVKSVKPDARVHVLWSGSWDDKVAEVQAADRLLQEMQVDVLTYHQNQPYAVQAADEAGVCSIGYHEVVGGLSEQYLTAAVWDWEALYYEILREYVRGESNTVKRHWFGIETGVVKLSEYSSVVSEQTRERVETVTQELIGGKHVFSGVIYDNQGTLRCDEGEAISDEVLLEKMNWYVDGVVLYE